MFAKRVFILAVFVVIISTQSGLAQQRQRAIRGRFQKPLPEDVIVHRDVEYAKVGDTKLLLDIYFVPRQKIPPLVVWIHGGGWKNGSKLNGGRVRYLLQHGYAVADINYRLTDEAIFPAQIFDCKAAIRWLRAHAKEYGYDPNRIGVAGSSAGGHLAALLGTSGDVKELEGTLGNHLDQSSRVQAVCSMWGPSDFTLIGEGPRPPRSPEVLLLGGTVSEKREKAILASPVTHITKDDPPFLVLHGDQDRIVGVRQSKVLKKSLDAAGVPCTLEILENAAHGGGGFPMDKMNQMILDFFERHLKNAQNLKKQD